MAKLVQKAYNGVGGDYMHVTLDVLVHPSEDGGYWAEVPLLGGCFTQGDTIEEIKERTPEAVELFLEDTPFDGTKFILSFEVKHA
jgi:predicted RNase H-like HicB family nuclease